MSRPAFGRFVALTERDAPQLLARKTKAELGIDAERYGIRSRLVVRPDATLLGLATAVFEKLCTETGHTRENFRGIVLSSRNLEIENEAQQLQQQLGGDLVVRGIERACSGFPAATALAVEMVEQLSGLVAVITAETISRNINWELPDGSGDDHSRARGQASKLFADGAAAVVVEPVVATGTHEILDAWSSHIPDEDQLLQKAEVEDVHDPWGHVRHGVTTCITMPGRRGFQLLKRGPQVMTDALAESLARVHSAGRSSHGIVAAVVHHQANGLMVPRLEQALADTTWGATARVFDCIADHGNTVSATIPLAMADVQDELPPNSLVGMPSVGAGGPGYRPDVLSVGCVLIRTAAESA